MKKMMKNRLFTTQLVADLISNFGNSLFALAVLQYVLTLPQQEATIAISIVTLSESLPMLIHIYTGYLADRTKTVLTAIFATLFARAFFYGIIGIIVGFTPSLAIVMAIAVINFLSDILGNYESGLYTQIMMKIVSNEDRSDFMAFRQTVTASASILFKMLSAFLVTWLTYRQLAFVNAGTFALSAVVLMFIVPALKRLIPQYDKELENEGTIETSKLSFIQQVKTVYKNVKEHDLLANTTLSFVFFNAAFSSISIFLMQYMNLYDAFIIINVATTNTILTTLLAAENIIGSLLSMNLLKNTSLLSLLRYTYITGLGMFVGLLIQNIYVLFIALLLTSTFSSAIMPKYSALIMNTLPENILATTLGALNTLLPIGAMLTSVILSILLPIVPTIWLVLINTAVILYLTVKIFKVRTETML